MLPIPYKQCKSSPWSPHSFEAAMVLWAWSVILKYSLSNTQSTLTPWGCWPPGWSPEKPSGGKLLESPSSHGRSPCNKETQGHFMGLVVQEQHMNITVSVIMILTYNDQILYKTGNTRTWTAKILPHILLLQILVHIKNSNYLQSTPNRLKIPRFFPSSLGNT